uniref:Uncharacterized protein n=1 Tax=Arundo donax TaxID=35708 RepID=A0A0A9ASH1_ARUDO
MFRTALIWFLHRSNRISLITVIFSRSSHPAPIPTAIFACRMGSEH